MVKKILVTGSAGFIGFHVCLALKARGDHVVGYDNFDPYYDVGLKRARNERLYKHGIEVVEGDINDLKKLEELFEKEGFSHVIHLAAQAGVRYSIVNPQAYVHSNLNGFTSILELVRKHPKTPLIYASSSSVYGMNKKTPYSESDMADAPVSFYGATKKANEVMAHAYHHLYGIPVTGLRFFTVYGPWGRPDMAYYSFSKAILEGRPIQVYNHGKLKRDFTYIDDIVEGVIQAVDASYPCEIFNLGNHQPVELIRFIEILEQHLGKVAKKDFVPMQQGDVLATYADIDHSRQKLGYEPKTSLEIGLKKFVNWLVEKKI